MKKIKADPELRLQVLVSGMHLSTEFGSTYREIEKDGFFIDEKVEMLLSSDTCEGICKSAGMGLIGFGDALMRLCPDALVVLGDRFEAFAAASAAMICRIPIAHIHGGEATRGLIDEPIRHSITKMSHFHFTSTEAYRKRVIQLGEQPDRVFCVGALGVAGLKDIDLLPKDQLEQQLSFSFQSPTVLVTFHPVTLEHFTAESQISCLLQALERIDDVKVIFTRSNADTHGRVINRHIEAFVQRYPGRAAVYTSLGTERYLSAMRFADAVVGNSSSGIIEAPFFKVPTVDIGDRQAGRIKPESVISCSNNTGDIVDALQKALSPEFRSTLDEMINPYVHSGTIETIVSVLKKSDLSHVLKKNFFDIAFSTP